MTTGMAVLQRRVASTLGAAYGGACIPRSRDDRRRTIRSVVAADVRAARERVLEQAAATPPRRLVRRGGDGGRGAAPSGSTATACSASTRVSGLRSVMFSRHGLRGRQPRGSSTNETVEQRRQPVRRPGARRAGRSASSPAAGRARPAQPAAPRDRCDRRATPPSCGWRWSSGGTLLGGAVAVPRRAAAPVHRGRRRRRGRGADGAAQPAVRRYQAGRPGTERCARRAGVVLVDRDGSVGATDRGRACLAGRALPTPGRTAPPRTTSAGWCSRWRTAAPGRPLRRRLPGADARAAGGWSWPARGSTDGSGDVAVVLQAGTSEPSSPRSRAWCGLTRQGVARCCAWSPPGWPRKQMARRLDLSVLTVNDHLQLDLPQGRRLRSRGTGLAAVTAAPIASRHG